LLSHYRFLLYTHQHTPTSHVTSHCDSGHKNRMSERWSDEDIKRLFEYAKEKNCSVKEIAWKDIKLSSNRTLYAIKKKYSNLTKGNQQPLKRRVADEDVAMLPGHLTKKHKAEPVMGDRVKPVMGDRVKPVMGDRVKQVIDDRVKPVIDDRVKPVIDDRVKPVMGDRVKPVIDDRVTTRQVIDDQLTRMERADDQAAQRLIEFSRLALTREVNMFTTEQEHVFTKQLMNPDMVKMIANIVCEICLQVLK